MVNVFRNTNQLTLTNYTSFISYKYDRSGLKQEELAYFDEVGSSALTATELLTAHENEMRTL